MLYIMSRSLFNVITVLHIVGAEITRRSLFIALDSYHWRGDSFPLYCLFVCRSVRSVRGSARKSSEIVYITPEIVTLCAGMVSLFYTVL